MRYMMLLFALLLLLTNCSEKTSTPAVNEDADYHASLVRDDVVTANSAFALDIMQALVNSGEENIFISPLSLSLALSMTMNGASGNTLTQMQEVLHYDTFSIEELNEQCYHLISSLLEVDPAVDLGLANSIWIKAGFPVQQQFIDVNVENFLAEIFPEQPFNNQTLLAVNQWVSDNTNGLITNVLQEIDPWEVMYLINALYFNANWTFRFDPEDTVQMTFFLDNGEEVEALYMSSSGLDFTYRWEETFAAVRLPYGDGDLAMYVFLPEEDHSITKLLQSIDIEEFSNWFDGYELIPVEFQEGTDFCLPLFDIEYSVTCNDYLIGLGMHDAFSELADFSRITNQTLWISYVKQDACISVDEAGTEAAAATIVSMANGVHPFVVNKPFLYIIRDDRNGTLLFTGIMNDPSM
ncbi:MAG: serpin family protein [Candidatus Cloacimonetes bacterium]|nr:serpin family protein [Candidatus Cloacimonadota bacterium]